MSGVVVLTDIGRGDEIVVQDRGGNVAVGPACFTKDGDLCVQVFGQAVKVARRNRNGNFIYVAAGIRVVGHQPPLGI